VLDNILDIETGKVGPGERDRLLRVQRKALLSFVSSVVTHGHNQRDEAFFLSNYKGWIGVGITGED